MDNKENHIDWDRLLELLEGGQPLPGSLTDAEKAALEDALEVRLRLNMDRFPTEQGWERFVAETQKQEVIRKRRRYYLLRWASAAAVLVFAAIGTSWWLNTRQHSAGELVKQGTDQIVLRRSSGTVALGHGSQSLGDSSVQIQADEKGVVYSGSQVGKIAKMIYDTLEVPRGKTYALQLPDGSKVVLNAASSLIFPEAFQGNTRQVYVQGEAFFDIRHDPGSAFIVHAGRAEMKVLGTSFGVNTFNEGLTTTLVSGKLMVSSASDRVILSPGEQSTCNPDGRISKQKVDARLYTAWSHGDLFFDNERLENITENLGRTYDYDFEFRDRSLEDIRLTLDMPKPPSLEEVFKQIQLTGTKLKVNIQGRKVVVMRDK